MLSQGPQAQRTSVFPQRCKRKDKSVSRHVAWDSLQRFSWFFETAVLEVEIGLFCRNLALTGLYLLGSLFHLFGPGLG
jgi:hypothetical protein